MTRARTHRTARDERGGAGESSPYLFGNRDESLLVQVDGKGNESSRVLANFSAKIVEAVSIDDGLEMLKVLRIEARVAGKTILAEVRAADFDRMEWVTPELGPKAIVFTGARFRDHLRTAIQMLSGDVLERRVFSHTGWIRHGDENVYLHAGGAIGGGGIVEGIEVRPGAPIDMFRLETPENTGTLRDAIRASFRLVELARDSITIPALASAYRAPVEAANFSVFFLGTTGSRKTEVASLIQRHFGSRMDAEHCPGSWTSTANANEDLAFQAKDALLLLDDFNPTGSQGNVQKKHAEADRLLRGAANGSGRQRMRANGTLVPRRDPRGLILATGEEAPAGHSLQARIVTLPLGSNEVDLRALSVCQGEAGLYPIAMGGFVQWLAPQLQNVREAMGKFVPQERDAILSRASHGRTATAAAHLLFGWDLLIRFAEEMEVIEPGEATALRERGRTAITKVVEIQTGMQASAKPTRVFLESIAAALESGEAHLVDRLTGEVPSDKALARLSGWRCSEPDGDAVDWKGHGQLIGYVDPQDRSVYLIPDASRRLAVRYSSTSTNPLTTSAKMLSRALKSEGLLASMDGDRATKKVRVAGSLRSGWHFQLGTIFPEAAGGKHNDVPVVPDGVAEAGTGDAAFPSSSGLFPDPVPSVPFVPVEREDTCEECLTPREGGEYRGGSFAKAGTPGTGGSPPTDVFGKGDSGADSVPNSSGNRDRVAGTRRDAQPSDGPWPQESSVPILSETDADDGEAA